MPTRKSKHCKECRNNFFGPDKQNYCTQACAKNSRKGRKRIIQCIKCGLDVECHVQGIKKYCNSCNPKKTVCASSRGGDSYKVLSRVQLAADGSKEYVCLKCERVCQTPASLGGHIRTHFNFEDVSTDRARKIYLIKEAGHRCWICQNSEWMGKSIPLELDHIDGNSTNSNRLNLRIVCPNCHAQTPTYKAKNKGNGSKARQKMYESARLRASGM